MNPLEDEVDNVLVWRPLFGEDLLAIIFIMPGMNLAWMEMLSVIVSENKDSVSFQGDQHLACPPTLLM